MLEPLTASSGDGGRVAQMAWGPDAAGGVPRLFVATVEDGIHRFDYDTAGPLTNRVQVSPVGSLGVAFHDDPLLNGAGGAVMYLSEYRGAGVNALIRRITDTNGDDVWGGPGDVNQEIINRIPLGNIPWGHHVNQLLIDGDTLFVGIGVGSNAGDNESAYTGTISWIEDLTRLSGDTTTPDVAGLRVGNWRGDARPFTSTARGKLRVHSSGTRNPFGLALDGDGELWVTVNQIDGPRPWQPGEYTSPQDQLFRTFHKADYAYQDGVLFWQRNAVHDWRADSDVIAAGFFDPAKRAISRTRDLPDQSYVAADPSATSGLPHGLGPNSSADGFDFYDGNGLSVRWHKDAFVTRQSQSIQPPMGPYLDVCVVDLDCGEVVRVADGFSAPLDALADELGNILVGEVGFSFQSKIYRIRPAEPILAAHPFEWAAHQGGRWSDRTRWVCDYDGDGQVDGAIATTLRKVPHAWGSARYDVAIDRPGFPGVRLDQDVSVERLRIADHLILDGRVLTVTDQVEVQVGGALSGNGSIVGDVVAGGAIAPGHRHGETIGAIESDGDLVLTGVMVLELGRGADGFDSVSVSGQAALSGVVRVTLLSGFQPQTGDAFDVVVAGSLVDQGYTVVLPPSPAMQANITTLGDGRQALRLVVL
jgi:hypothetical protein